MINNTNTDLRLTYKDILLFTNFRHNNDIIINNIPLFPTTYLDNTCYLVGTYLEYAASIVNKTFSLKEFESVSRVYVTDCYSINLKYYISIKKELETFEAIQQIKKIMLLL